MVYRGKPSAGCEHCRHAKKRCTLEVPACSRCVKLKKICSGYRDTTSLQIQDETQRVTRRAEARQAQSSSNTPPPRRATHQQSTSRVHAPDTEQLENSGLGFFDAVAPTNRTTTPVLPFTTAGSDLYPLPLGSLASAAVALFSTTPSTPRSEPYGLKPSFSFSLDSNPPISPPYSIPYSPRPAIDDIAVNFFLSCFVTKGHWNYIPHYAALPRLDPCLTLAIRACGMAALDNVRPVPRGREWSRKKYVEALGLLNSALRNEKRARADESLMAVTLLSLYENLTCDGPQSIHSWKAHMTGAAQLLKVRGKEQFKTEVGQNLFRETRAQIMIHCMWDDLEPPSFLRDWMPSLQLLTQNLSFIQPADDMMLIAFDFSTLGSQIKNRIISNTAAYATANEIDSRLTTWALETPLNDIRWAYTTEIVPDAPHVWNGQLHAYTGLPTPGVWNLHRSVRAMVSRTQGLLARRLHLPPATRAAQTAHFRSVRRQVTDDICASIPCQLGLTPPGIFRSQNVLLTAYNSIWPLFFAGTCALERCSHSVFDPPEMQKRDMGNAAQAQLSWICAQLDYISDVVGLRWARGVGNTLKGDFSVLAELRPEFEDEEQDINADAAFAMVEGEQGERRALPTWDDRALVEHARSDVVWQGRNFARELV